MGISGVCLPVCLSVCLSVLSVCLFVTNKHVNISRTAAWIFMKFCTQILQKKISPPKNFGHPSMTIWLLNPEFDFFTIQLSLWRWKKIHKLLKIYGWIRIAKQWTVTELEFFSNKKFFLFLFLERQPFVRDWKC